MWNKLFLLYFIFKRVDSQRAHCLVSLDVKPPLLFGSLAVTTGDLLFALYICSLKMLFDNRQVVHVLGWTARYWEKKTIPPNDKRIGEATGRGLAMATVKNLLGKKKRTCSIGLDHPWERTRARYRERKRQRVNEWIKQLRSLVKDSIRYEH